MHDELVGRGVRAMQTAGRWRSALPLLSALACARAEPAPPAGTVPAPLASTPSVRAPAPATPAPVAAMAGAAATPRRRAFESLGSGLSVFASERLDAEGEPHQWRVVRLDLKAHRLQVRARGEAPFEELRSEPDVLAAVNGGFFDPEVGASGLLISEGVALARERPGGGSGVLVIAAGVARLLERGARLPAKTELAVQCGPRLIEPDGSVGIRSDDGQRAARTAACIRQSGRELDLVVAASETRLGRGPGLLQLARWLAEPLAPDDPSGCEAALNLDGGPSTALVVADAPELFRAPLGPVPFALVVPRPR